MTSQSKDNRLLPLTVIEAAAGGDVEAINAVLKHYAGYIARLSMRELYDEYGNPHLCVDEELRRRLCDVTRSVSKMTEIERRGGKRWDKPKKAGKSRDCRGGKF